MKRELERIEIPDEHGARERSLAVVREAFAEREPQPHRRSWKPVATSAIGPVGRFAHEIWNRPRFETRIGRPPAVSVAPGSSVPVRVDPIDPQRLHIA